MKKFLLICGMVAAGSLAMMAAEAKPGILGRNHRIPEAQAKFRVNVKQTLSRATAASEWKPGSISNYYWNYDESAEERWMFSGTTTYMYNEACLVKEYNSPEERCVYTYNSDWRVESAVYSNPENEYPMWKEEFVYDTVVKDFVVKTTGYVWNSETNKWVESNCERCEITRNADGNITKVATFWVRFEDGQKSEYPQDVFEIGYGQDKRANSIKMSYYENDQLEVDAELTDIVWYQTDGQILFFETDEPEFYFGANRIKSARGPKAVTYPYIADIYYTVEYKADNKGYTFTAMMDGEKYEEIDYTILDEYGSYRETNFSIDYDYDDDTESYVRGDNDYYVMTEIYDAYGIVLTSLEQSYADGNPEGEIIYSGLIFNEVTYDETNGYPLESIEGREYDGENRQYSSRKVYADYKLIENTGVEEIVDGAELPVEFYNLQGVRVANPSNGIFIRRQGSKATKVMVR